MIIIGGRISAKIPLAQQRSQISIVPQPIALKAQMSFQASWFEGAEYIGITAGASTPEAHINAVKSAIEQIVGA